MDSAFNLIYEPWIRVRTDDKVSEVSLQRALSEAHTYSALAGEMPTQDLAILRLLLAVLHASLYGMEVEYEDEADIPLNQWEAIWKQGRFPAERITAYLKKWEDRFFLFDETYPFYQVSDVEIKKEPFLAAKLNGMLSESANKARLFSPLSGDEKSSLSFSEAARWLIHLNAWADNASCKNYIDKETSLADNKTKGGWLGKLGNIYAVGNNLFETLMLNLVLIDCNRSPSPGEHPVWEKKLSAHEEQAADSDTVRPSEYGLVTPDNQAELLTLLSRYILLERENDVVVHAKVACKTIISQKNCFAEYMTMWKPVKKNGAVDDYEPQPHDPAKQIWREFSSIIPAGDGNRRPFICQWICMLMDGGVLPQDTVLSFHTCGVKYDDAVGSSVVNSFSDSLTLHASLLTELGAAWNQKIGEEIAVCDRAADLFQTLQKELLLAQTSLSKKTWTSTFQRQTAAVRESFYARIDLPFRRWIEGIDPAGGGQSMADQCGAWRETLKQIARGYAKELALAAGPKAMAGRENTFFEKNAKKRHYSTPEAMNHFHGRLNQL